MLTESLKGRFYFNKWLQLSEISGEFCFLFLYFSTLFFFYSEYIILQKNKAIFLLKKIDPKYVFL